MDALTYRQETAPLLTATVDKIGVTDVESMFAEIVHTQFRKEVFLSSDDISTIEESHRALTSLMLQANHDSDYIFKP